MIVTWYFDRDAKVMDHGSFHYEQAIALQKYADMAILFPIDKSDIKGITKQEERELLTYRLAQKNTFLPMRFMEMMRDAKKVVEDFKPDVLHAQVAGMAGVVAAILGKKYNIPVVITEHNPIEMAHYESHFNRIKDRYAYKSSKANLCVSKNLRDKLSKMFSDIPFEVMYNGIINPEDVARDGVSYAKKGRYNIVIVGAFYDREVKGYQYLLPAIKILITENVPVTLHICGGGIYLDEYIQMAKELGIEDNCIFYDMCDRIKLYSIMEQGDFCVSASLYESAGMFIEEAMLLGKPSVVTNSGGVDSLVTKDSAIVVKNGSTEALVMGIKEMIERLDSFDKNKIKNYAKENFEIDNISKKYMETYKNSLGKV